MEARTVQQASTAEQLPVFVADGRRRNRAVRLLAATAGLLLAGWLAALAAGLVGLAPLPRLALPGAGQGDAISAPQHPVAGGVGGRSIRTSLLAPGTAGAMGSASQTGGSQSATAGQAASQSNGAGSAASRSRATGLGATRSTAAQSQTTPQPAAGSSTQTSSGSPPSYTPPASGDQSATPPHGNSASAPGATTSADARSSTATGYWPIP